MSKFKTIFDNNCAFGGYECHVTSNGEIVHVKMRHSPSSSTFKIVAKMTLESWERFFEKNELSNPYKQNPAILIRAFAHNN